MNVVACTIKSDNLNKGEVSVPVVDAVVTCSDDKKKLAIALVNKDPDKETECDLGIAKIDGMAEAIVLSGDSPDAYNDIDRPDRVVPKASRITIKDGKVTIPAHSLVILNIKNRKLSNYS